MLLMILWNNDFWREENRYQLICLLDAAGGWTGFDGRTNMKQELSRTFRVGTLRQIVSVKDGGDSKKRNQQQNLREADVFSHAKCVS